MAPFPVVWLAISFSAARSVSSKVVAADASKHSLESQKDTIRQGNISSLLDVFSLSGPNGNFTCFVSETLGSNVLGFKKRFAYDLLPFDISRRITAR